MISIEEKFPALFDENDDLYYVGRLFTKSASLSNNFGFRQADIVFITLPETDDLLPDLFEECIAQKVQGIIAVTQRDAAYIAQTIREEQVSVLAISPAQWPLVFQELNAQPEKITRMQVIISDGKGKTETRFSLVPVLSPKL